MSEQRMRELGRDGGVAWLAERLRRGDLERSMVELAAYAGDAEARRVVPQPDGCIWGRECSCGWSNAEWLDRDDHVCLDKHLGDWLRGLERWPGALREAELACDVLEFGHEVSGAARATRAEWCLRVARAEGEQRVREAICERLCRWVIG